MAKKQQRYDLWILGTGAIRLIESDRTLKKCRKIGRRFPLNRGERMIATPRSREAYCPLLYKSRHDDEE
jgi:hypothetical protein